MPTGHAGPAGRGRHAALAAAAILLLGGAATVIKLHEPRGAAHARVVYCGLIACAALPPASTTASAPATGLAAAPAPRRARVRRRTSAASSPSARTPAATPAPPHKRRPTPRPAPTPTPTPTPTPASAPVIATVTYSMPQRWQDGFQGELTIVNQTGSPLSGWQITIMLPGDQVDSVWNADWQQAQGNSVIMTAASYDAVIGPGASVSVNFTAQGDTTSPTSCSFDGSACQPAAAGPASARARVLAAQRRWPRG